MPIVSSPVRNGSWPRMKEARPAVLELLTHAAESVQVIYLTNDEDVASWARLEALTGALSIIEPTTERAPERLTRPT